MCIRDSPPSLAVSRRRLCDILVLAYRMVRLGAGTDRAYGAGTELAYDTGTELAYEAGTDTAYDSGTELASGGVGAQAMAGRGAARPVQASSGGRGGRREGEGGGGGREERGREGAGGREAAARKAMASGEVVPGSVWSYARAVSSTDVCYAARKGNCTRIQELLRELYCGACLWGIALGRGLYGPMLCVPSV
eukprot:1013797-Rhodomonas_salina.1